MYSAWTLWWQWLLSVATSIPSILDSCQSISRIFPMDIELFLIFFARLPYEEVLISDPAHLWCWRIFVDRRIRKEIRNRWDILLLQEDSFTICLVLCWCCPSSDIFGSNQKVKECGHITIRKGRYSNTERSGGLVGWNNHSYSPRVGATHLSGRECELETLGFDSQLRE